MESTPPESIVFDRAADFYDATRGFPPGEEKHIAALFARAAGQVSCLLEVGVGTGRIALPLAPYAKTYYGIDLSRLMMKRLRTKQTSESISLVEGDIGKLPFASGVFDAVIAVHVFHLVSDWQNALSEVGRVLRQGGVLLHGGGDSRGTRRFKPLLDAWEAAIQAEYRSSGSAKSNIYETYLLEHGWQRVGDVWSHRYTVERSPQDFVDQLAARTWSSTWRLTDEQLARGIAAVNAAIANHFENPQQQVQVDHIFEVRALRAPG